MPTCIECGEQKEEMEDVTASCNWCSGSGEGMNEYTKCMSCNGGDITIEVCTDCAKEY